jgi:AraC-like DNA-binding protein
MATQNPSAPCRLAALGLAREGAVRIAPLLHLPRFLADHGLDPDAVIRAQGCDPALFEDPDNTIAFTAVGGLLARAATLTGCADVGLQVGRQQGLDVLGAVGRAARLAPDVGSGLRCLILNLHLHDRGAVPYLWTSGGRAMFGYTLYCSDVVGTEYIYDGALAIVHNLIRELAGPDWHPTEVRLFRDAPGDLAAFRAHFHARLRFRAPQAAVVFPAADLDRPLRGADPAGYAAALQALESLDATAGLGLADKVRRVLLRLLVSGACLNDAVLDRAAIAALFALHPRTMNRRLGEQGTSFAALLAEARYAIARELLRDTRLQVEDIAGTLGYAETASFLHAFRRWSGTTTTAWRAQSQQGRQSSLPLQPPNAPVRAQGNA